MEQELLEQISVTQMKRSKKIELNQCKTIQEMRDITLGGCDGRMCYYLPPVNRHAYDVCKFRIHKRL